MSMWSRSAASLLLFSLLQGAVSQDSICDVMVLTGGTNFTTCSALSFGDIDAVCACAKSFKDQVSEAACDDALLSPEAQVVINKVDAACVGDVPLPTCPVVVSSAVSALGTCIAAEPEDEIEDDQACTCVKTFNETVASCIQDEQSKSKIDMTVAWGMTYCGSAAERKNHAQMCAAVGAMATSTLKDCMAGATATQNSTGACQCLEDFQASLMSCKEDLQAETEAAEAQREDMASVGCKVGHCLPHENCCPGACCSLGSSCNTCPFGFYAEDSSCAPQGNARCKKVTETNATDEECAVRIDTIANCSSEMSVAQMQLSACLAASTGEYAYSTACECMQNFRRPASCEDVPANRYAWNQTLLGENATMAARLCSMESCAKEAKSMKDEVMNCIDTHKAEDNWETTVCAECFDGFNESMAVCRDDPASAGPLALVDGQYATWCQGDCLRIVSEAESHMQTCIGTAEGSIEKMCSCMTTFNATTESCDAGPVGAVRARWPELGVCSASAHILQCVETVGLAATALATCIAQSADEACTCASTFNATVQGCEIEEVGAKMREAQALMGPLNCDGPAPGPPLHCATIMPPAMTGFTTCVATAGSNTNELCACVTRLLESVDECMEDPAVSSSIRDIKGMYPECAHMDQVPEVDGQWILTDVASPAAFVEDSSSIAAVKAAVAKLSGCSKDWVELSLIPGSASFRRLTDTSPEHTVTADWVLRIPPESAIEGQDVLHDLESTTVTDITTAVNTELGADGQEPVTVAASSVWQPTTSSTEGATTTEPAPEPEDNSSIGLILLAVGGCCAAVCIGTGIMYCRSGAAKSQKRSIKKPRTRGLAATAAPAATAMQGGPPPSSARGAAVAPVGLQAPPGVSAPLLQPLPFPSAPTPSYLQAPVPLLQTATPLPTSPVQAYAAGNGGLHHASVTPLPTVTMQMPTYSQVVTGPVAQPVPVTFSSAPFPAYTQPSA